MSLEKTAEALHQTLSSLDQKINPLLEITVSNACNKRCSYCFECKVSQAQIDPEEEARQLEIVKRVCREFDHEKFGRLNLSFWGGEPLVNVRWLEQILLATVDYEFVDYHLFTNGTLVGRMQQLLDNKALQQAFKCGRFSVQVSYDGEPHHKLKRGYDGGEALKMIELLAQRSVPFSLKATIAADSIAMMPQCWESYAKLYARFGKSVQYAPAIDTSSSLEEIDFAEVKRAFTKIAKSEFKFIKKNNHPLMAWLQAGQKKICDVRYSIHMHSDGNLYVCHGAPYQEDSRRQQLVVATTKELEKMPSSLPDFLFRDDAIDITKQNTSCQDCDAVFCGICHVSCVDASKYQQDWLPCMAKQKKRCQIYQMFGYMARALRFALLTNR